MRYTYTYKTSDGVRHEDAIEAKSKDDVFIQLRARKIKPIRVFDPPKTLWQKIGWRWTIIAGLTVALVSVLLAFMRFTESHPDEPDMLTRRQLYGDAATIADGVRSGWAAAFAKAGDRYLAYYVQPGLTVRPPSVTPDEVKAVLTEDVAPTENDSVEVRQVKRMVRWIKDEAREYLAAGGNVEGYMSRLADRQVTEDAYWIKTSVELNKLAEFAKNQSAKVRESTVEEWKKRNASLRAMGLRTIPLPPFLIDIEND